jgi:hypothetical protein
MTKSNVRKTDEPSYNASGNGRGTNRQAISSVTKLRSAETEVLADDRILAKPPKVNKADVSIRTINEAAAVEVSPVHDAEPKSP